MPQSQTPWWAGNQPRQTRRRFRVPALVVVLVGTTAFLAPLAPRGAPPQAAVLRDGSVLTYQSQSALLAQCGPSYTSSLLITPRPQRDVEPAPAEPRFYGPRDPNTPSRPSLGEAMREGRMVVFYAQGAREEDRDVLEVMSSREDLNMIVVPDVTGVAVNFRNFAFMTSSTVQRCYNLAPRALEDFRAANPNPADTSDTSDTSSIAP